MKTELELSQTKQEVQECSEKLPKLVISEYDSSFVDWPRFGGQYCEVTDKCSIPTITKFTNLRELLSPKVRRCVEALPFTPEGYNCAKSILLGKYGKESEIVNSYVK